jgi:uncharacterized protein YdhG (YjbR/CyaY superfamily)
MNEIDKYIQSFPDEIQEILYKIRGMVKELAPGAEEKMAYGMPGYKTNKRPLIYFASYKNHIGLYATPEAHDEFKEELSGYKQGKGSVQFPLKCPIPYDLIERIIKFKIEVNKLK